MSIEPTKSMSFHLIYSLEDLLGSYSLLIRGTPTYKRRLRTIKVILVVGWLVAFSPLGLVFVSLSVLAMSSNLDNMPASDWQFIHEYLSVAGVTAIICYIMYLVYKHNILGTLLIRLMYKLRKTEATKPQEFTFDSTGCTIQKELERIEFKWQDFQLVLVGKNHLIFKTANKKVLSLPKRVCSNEMEYESLLELLKQNVTLVYPPQ